jgi:hypothetical protein
VKRCFVIMKLGATLLSKKKTGLVPGHVRQHRQADERGAVAQRHCLVRTGHGAVAAYRALEVPPCLDDGPDSCAPQNLSERKTDI